MGQLGIDREQANKILWRLFDEGTVDLIPEINMDRVPHVLSMKQQFMDYIEQNMNRFGVAVAMRPMMLPAAVWVP